MSQNRLFLLIGSISVTCVGAILGAGLAVLFLLKAPDQPMLAQPDFTQGLIAYYPFTGNAHDESGHDNQAQVFGATLTQDRFGHPNQAYHFDGVDDFIEIPDSPKINVSGEISLAAWIWVNQAEFFPAIVSKGNVGNYHESYALYLTPDNQLGFLVNRDGTMTGRSNFNSLTKIPLQQWIHVVGTANHDTLCIYVNGSLIGQVAYEGGNIITLPMPLLMGKSEREDSQYPPTFFNGSIDEIQVFNRYLAAADVQAMFQANSVHSAQ